MAMRLHSLASAGMVAMLCVPATTIPEQRERAAGDDVGAQAAPASCPGRAIAPDKVITGEFGTELQSSYVMLPFDVPAGTTAVRVKYCHDQPEVPVPGSPVTPRHTLDLGLYGPRGDPSGTWGVPEFRGWGGSSHPDVTVSAEGFSTEAQYTASPRVEVPGKTTRAFRPGPIAAGKWAVELGVAAVQGLAGGDTDEKVAWRVEIELSEDPTFADEPYQPAPYNRAPAKTGAGWYAGDFHVHGEHSAYGDATMTEVFDYAFSPLSQGKAGLDFITLSDYVSGSSWGEVGRYQPSYPGKLIMRSAEVITYRGHINNHNSARVVDYREGRIYERAENGSLTLRRGTQDASVIFDQIQRAGGFTQINHPTIFPNEVPGFAGLCRGCPWDYSVEETQYPKVDAIEVATGPPGLQIPPVDPGPNPFTLSGIQFWDSALGRNDKIAAVGSSDSHNAGRTPNPITQAPIGTATTVVYADDLSEAAIRRGVEAGHTYVKILGNDRPDLRFEARTGGPGPPAIMGDTVRAPSVAFKARVLGGAPGGTPDPFELVVLKNGTPMRTVPVTSDDFVLEFGSTGPGRYGLQLQRGTTIEAVSSPIYLERPGSSTGGGAATTGGAAARDERIRVGLGRHGRLRVRRGRFRLRCRVRPAGRYTCRVRLRRRGRTVGFGKVRLRRHRLVRIRLNRRGRRLLRRHRRLRVGVLIRATDPQGRSGRSRTRRTIHLARPRRR